MSDDVPVTTDSWYLLDPEIYPPPTASVVLLLNPGGVLIQGIWTDDCLAWSPKPKIPNSVKERMFK